MKHIEQLGAFFSARSNGELTLLAILAIIILFWGGIQAGKFSYSFIAWLGDLQK